MTIGDGTIGEQRSRVHPAVLVGLVTFIVALLAQVWAHRANVVFAFWDAQAHLDIARRVTDSLTPGLQMLGTVWLPVQHLLLLGPVQIDQWWWTGIAGGIVGITAFVIAAVSLHDILLRRTGDRGWAAIGTAFLVFNPSLLYLQTTAMSEPLLLAFLVSATALLDRWLDRRTDRTLIAAGILAALAVGTRYDGWFFALVGTIVVAWHAHRSGGAWIRTALVFALPSAIVVALWLGFNYAYFGDALEFQRGTWSAQSQQATLAAQGLLPTLGRPDLAIGYYLGAAAMTCGAFALCLAIACSWAATRSRGATALLLLSIAFVFNVTALVAGQSVIALPWTTPSGTLNVRYGVMLLPAIAALIALGMQRARFSRQASTAIALVVLVAQAALSIASPRFQVGALHEGMAIRDGDRRQQATSDWLRDHYDGGRVLVDAAVNLSPRTRIPLRDRVYEWTWQVGTAALDAPDAEVDWVVADARTAEDAVSRAITDRPDFTRRFDLAFSDGGIEVWRRR